MKKFIKISAFLGSLACSVCLLAAAPEMTSTTIQDPEQTINRSIEYAKNHDAFASLFFC